jgi:hypothetical protein
VRLSLKERRTRGSVQYIVQEIRGISLVFREMWDTTAPVLLTFDSSDAWAGGVVDIPPGPRQAKCP